MIPLCRIAPLLLAATTLMQSGCVTFFAWRGALAPGDPRVQGVLRAPGGGERVVASYGLDLSVLVPLEPDGTPAYPFGYAGTVGDLEGPRSVNPTQLRAICSTHLPRFDRDRTPDGRAGGDWLSKAEIAPSADTVGLRSLSKQGIAVFVLPPVEAAGGVAWGERVLLLPQTRPLPASEFLPGAGPVLFATPFLLIWDAFNTPAMFVRAMLGAGP